jgi:DNA-binding transcriptional LysR family regulator
MRKSDLLRHNVSHLVVFQSLLQTGNVTATAAELHMSQPAVSRALAHLREMFGDPLFVRAPGGVGPTDRATQLAPRVSDIVDGLSDLIAPQDFDLATTERAFRIATTDYGAGTVVLEIAKTFNAQAPRASLEIVPFSSDVFRDLAEGRLDIVLYADATVPESLQTERLFDETYSCLCRKGHPVIAKQKNGSIPLDSFLAWPHALITVFGGRFGLIDTLLKEKGLERNIALRLPYFSTAPLIVARSDMLLTLPTRTARYFAGTGSLECLEAPLQVPEFGYIQVWHKRTELDPAAMWLRTLIKDTYQAEG